MYGKKGEEWGRGRKTHTNKYVIPYVPVVLFIQRRHSFRHNSVTLHIAEFLKRIFLWKVTC